jgi:hypothetical protein
MGKTTQELINGRCPYYPNIGPSIGIPFGVEIPEDLPDELLKNALRVIKK